MKKEINLFDTVALLEDLPQRNLQRGEVGSVVEILAPDVYEVEFCDDNGRTYAAENSWWCCTIKAKA